VEVKSKVVTPLKMSCILGMLPAGNKDLPHNHCFGLCQDQIRAEEVTLNELLFPPSQRFSDLKERLYKAFKSYRHKLRKIRRKIHTM